MADEDIIVISSDSEKESRSTSAIKFCSKHQHLLNPRPRLIATNTSSTRLSHASPRPSHSSTTTSSSTVAPAIQQHFHNHDHDHTTTRDQQQLNKHRGPTSGSHGHGGGEVIVISDDVDVVSLSSDSNSDVKLIDVDVQCRIKVAVHTCNKSKARVQEVQHAPSCSHGSIFPVTPQTKSSPFKGTLEIAGIHAPQPIHTCTKHRGLVPNLGGIGSPSKTRATPVAAVLPRPRSRQDSAQEVQLTRKQDVPSGSNHGNTVETVISPQPSSSQAPQDRPLSHTRGALTQRPGFSVVSGNTNRTRASPTKRMLSRQIRNKRRSSLQQQQATSSTDSDLEYESSPASRARHQRPRSRARRRKRAQKENLHSTNAPHGGASPVYGEPCRRRIGTEQDRMYLDKVVEPITHEHPLSNMPVRTEMLTNLHLNKDILGGDLPVDNARDPAKDGNLKRDSQQCLKAEKIEGGRKSRMDSVYSSPMLDSDSDNEIANVKWTRDANQADSRQDTSSPEEVVIYQEMSRKAMQENALVRNGSHHRIASPHRSPLQVTQDQARVCSPRNCQRRIRDSELAYNPPKRQKTGAAFRELNLNIIKRNEQSIKAQKPLKQHEVEPPILLTSSDAEGLPPIKWNLTQKKEKVSQEDSKNRLDSPKTNVISEPQSAFRSAFSVLKQPNSTSDPGADATGVLRKSHSAETIDRLCSAEQQIGSEAEHRTSSHGNRSAFEFIKQVKDSLSQSDSSDFEAKSSFVKPVASTPSRARHIGPDGFNIASVSDHIVQSEEKESNVNRELYIACIPEHFKAPEMCNKSGDSREEQRDSEDSNEMPPNIMMFGNLIQTLLEGCQEEGHHNDAVDFIQSFTNTHRCPQNNCLKYILEDILEKVDSHALFVNSFSTLKHVQNLHPPSIDKFLLHWKLFGRVVKVLLANGASQNSVSILKLQGNFMVLKYLTSLFAEDLEMQNKNGSLHKSYVHNLLSADTCIANVRNVINWICSCVKRIKEEEDLQHYDNVQQREDAAPPQSCSRRLLFSRTSQEKLSPLEDHSHTRLTILLMVLELLQKLLHMCLVVSSNLGQSASKVADEFVYYYSRLPDYCTKRRVLQTITCHHMRVKLIELILDNCYEVGQDVLDQRSLSLSISKIVEFYFKCIPPTNIDDDNDDDDSSEEEIQEKKVARDPPQDCEQLVMLLMYLMQSYVWSSNGKPLETDRTLRYRLPIGSHQASRHSANQLMPFHGKFTLSMNDKEYLIMMGDYVDELQKRLEAYCPALTTRTKLYLRHLDAMRDLADCV